MITCTAVSFRLAVPGDAARLVALRDDAARWMERGGIAQWRPGELDESHFLRRMAEGEVWLAEDDAGRVAGAFELWWSDEHAWGPRPPVAGYVHRLMTDRATALPGLGRVLLAHAELRITAEGRSLARLDCVATNPRLRGYYEAAGYAVVGERAGAGTPGGSPYGVTLLEKPLAPQPADRGAGSRAAVSRAH